jgi:hypothetical protein
MLAMIRKVPELRFMGKPLRVQAEALRLAALDLQTDPLLKNMMLETASELEALADQIDSDMIAAAVAPDIAGQDAFALNEMAVRN